MNKLKPFTKYLVNSVEQLLEIKKACEEQGISFRIPSYNYKSVGIVYFKGGSKQSSLEWDSKGVDSCPDYTLLEWVSDNVSKQPLNPFENTYIDTGHLSIEAMGRIAGKYLKALGTSPEEYDYNLFKGSLIFKWEYIYTHLNRDGITPTDSHRDVEGLREINEQDLDNYLSNIPETSLDEGECIKYLKGLGYKVIKEF